MDCWRVQPSAWMPVSTTSRAARQASDSSAPKRSRGLAVEAHLRGQPLGVEGPALHEGAARQARAEAPEGRQAGQLLLDGDLEVVARHGLVEGRGGHAVKGPRGRVVGVDVVHALAAAVLAGRHVEGRRSLLLHVGLDGADLAAVARQAPEPARRLALGARDELLGHAPPAAAGPRRWLSGLPSRSRRSVADILVPELARDAPRLGLELGQPLEAVGVDGVRVLGQGRPGQDVMPVEGLAIGQVADAVAGPRAGRRSVPSSASQAAWAGRTWRSTARERARRAARPRAPGGRAGGATARRASRAAAASG